MSEIVPSVKCSMWSTFDLVQKKNHAGRVKDYSYIWLMKIILIDPYVLLKGQFQRYMYLVGWSSRTKSEVLWKTSSVECKWIVAVERFFSLTGRVTNIFATWNRKENDKNGYKELSFLTFHGWEHCGFCFLWFLAKFAFCWWLIWWWWLNNELGRVYIGRFPCMRICMGFEVNSLRTNNFFFFLKLVFVRIYAMIFNLHVLHLMTRWLFSEVKFT